ncbi:MAG: hypothetical protein SWY16_25485 [Cyanobacteriota bacterium]|nr:hypothetical protein [Cyanobacteriota bacterium]
MKERSNNGSNNPSRIQKNSWVFYNGYIWQVLTRSDTHLYLAISREPHPGYYFPIDRSFGFWNRARVPIDSIFLHPRQPAPMQTVELDGEWQPMQACWEGGRWQKAWYSPRLHQWADEMGRLRDRPIDCR